MEKKTKIYNYSSDSGTNNFIENDSNATIVFDENGILVKRNINETPQEVESVKIEINTENQPHNSIELIMKNSLKTFLVLLTVGLISCNGNINLGSGNIITEKRNVTERFDKINASSGVNVIITQGTPEEIVVETDDNVMQYVVT